MAARGARPPVRRVRQAGDAPGRRCPRAPSRTRAARAGEPLPRGGLERAAPGLRARARGAGPLLRVPHRIRTGAALLPECRLRRDQAGPRPAVRLGQGTAPALGVAGVLPAGRRGGAAAARVLPLDPAGLTTCSLTDACSPGIVWSGRYIEAQPSDRMTGGS